MRKCAEHGVNGSAILKVAKLLGSRDFESMARAGKKISKNVEELFPSKDHVAIKLRKVLDSIDNERLDSAIRHRYRTAFDLLFRPNAFWKTPNGKRYLKAREALLDLTRSSHPSHAPSISNEARTNRLNLRTLRRLQTGENLDGVTASDIKALGLSDDTLKLLEENRPRLISGKNGVEDLASVYEALLHRLGYKPLMDAEPKSTGRVIIGV